MSEQSQPPVYQPGQVVNNHVWTGTEWLPVVQPQGPKVKSVWVTLAGVVCLIVALLAGIQALQWMLSFNELESEGNQFAGILAVLTMGAGVIAAGFGVAGVLLLKK